MTDKKQTIRNYYGAIARGDARSCGCDAGPDTADRRTHVSGHAPADDRAHDGGQAVRMPNLGCGSPLGFAGIREGMTVVDLGSGSGREVFMAAAETGPSGRAIGIDMTASMIELAERNARALAITNAQFLLGDIDDIPLAGGIADRVVSNCVINLTHDKRRSFAEIHRILKPGGRISVSDIVSTGPLPAHLAGDPDAWCACVAGALPKEEYIAAIGDAGFHEVRIVAESGSCSGGELPVASITVTAVR